MLPEVVDTEERKTIVELTERVCRERIANKVRHWDEAEVFPEEAIDALREAGLFGVYIPQKYGGLGYGMYELCLVIECLSKVCASVATVYAASALGVLPILLFADENQKCRYLRGAAEGELFGFALTEENAGSDAAAIQTQAIPTKDSYKLSGKKQWISNAPYAKYYSVIAITDKTRGARGASCLVVEDRYCKFGQVEKKLGIRAAPTASIIFDDVEVPRENLINKEGMGFIIALRTLDYARPGVGAQAIGIAEGVLQECIKFSKLRTQFGKQIASFQAIQHTLADMATKIAAAKALLYHIVSLIDAGKVNCMYSAMSKLFASDICMEVSVNGVQLLGGYGYMREYALEKYLRDAKITQIYEGTNQIQRNIIAQELLKGQ